MTSDSITEQAARLIDPAAFTLVVNEEGADAVRARLEKRRDRARLAAVDVLVLLVPQAPATEPGVAAVLALHKRVTVPDDVDAEDAEDVEVCQECHAHDDERGVLTRGQWPCATITALTGQAPATDLPDTDLPELIARAIEAERPEPGSVRGSRDIDEGMARAARIARGFASGSAVAPATEDELITPAEGARSELRALLSIAAGSVDASTDYGRGRRDALDELTVALDARAPATEDDAAARAGAVRDATTPDATHRRMKAAMAVDEIVGPIPKRLADRVVNAVLTEVSR